MLSNSLTRDMSLKAGPLLLSTLVKHYFDRTKDTESAGTDRLARQDEILSDEVFQLIKSFMHESTLHTVEELQGFSNTHTPSSLSTHLVRTVVPLKSCEEAATYLVKALGGEDKAREVVGGFKWWQARTIKGIDAQWITAKKDWREAKKRRKTKQPSQDQNSTASSENNGTYEEYMDEMRCILYIHGGGYYFGSVDQERYSIQRHARKTNGRVFGGSSKVEFTISAEGVLVLVAVNYRLAPQYPFPCGLHDCLASYLYLIQPPPGADHSPIKPAHIVIAGDSAGGGMCLALLQVIRDSNLPLPAGAVLISPWCDLTHSFPSIHANTNTDILPPTGLSLHKPSILWPPPSPAESVRFHESLRQKVRRALTLGRLDLQPNSAKSEEPATSSMEYKPVSAQDMPTDLSGASPPPPVVGEGNPQSIMVKGEKGEDLLVDKQLHFYTQNSLLAHPLVSPALGYLGGLPPLLFVAGDKEVLRDEIIYTAHKAAKPHEYPIKKQIRSLYPLLEGIEERVPDPSSVHLQIYDGNCHVFPVLFAFSTPAKFCYRAMASFVKFVTGMPLTSPISASDSSVIKLTRVNSMPNNIQCSDSPEALANGLQPPPTGDRQSSTSSAPVSIHESENHAPTTPSPPSIQRRKSLRRAMSTRVTQVFRRKTLKPENLLEGIAAEEPTPRERYAGETAVYENIEDPKSFEMIRERVSTQGVIRPLESESELDAFTVPDATIGVFSEKTLKRYIENDETYQQKFAQTYKSVEKTRKKKLEHIEKEARKRFGGSGNRGGSPSRSQIKVREPQSSVWGYAWATGDKLENPPPSSIVARRDTEEALKLAKVADQAMIEGTSELNANSLWNVIMNVLTPPDRGNS